MPVFISSSSATNPYPDSRSRRRAALVIALLAGLITVLVPSAASGQAATSINPASGPLYADGVVFFTGTCPTDPGVAFLDVDLQFSDPSFNRTGLAEVDGTEWSAASGYLGSSDPLTMTATIDCGDGSGPATRTFDLLAPHLDLVATVGTEPGVCATTSTIEVAAGTPVYWCYTATSHSGRDHYGLSVSDDADGVLLEEATHVTAAGSTISSVDLGMSITDTPTADISRTGTWVLQSCDGNCVEIRRAQATAQVNILPAATEAVVPAPPAVPVPATPTFTG